MKIKLWEAILYGSIICTILSYILLSYTQYSFIGTIMALAGFPFGYFTSVLVWFFSTHKVVRKEAEK